MKDFEAANVTESPMQSINHMADLLADSQRNLGLAMNALQQFANSGNWEFSVGGHAVWVGHNQTPRKIASQVLAQIVPPKKAESAEDSDSKRRQVVHDLPADDVATMDVMDQFASQGVTIISVVPHPERADYLRYFVSEPA